MKVTGAVLEYVGPKGTHDIVFETGTVLPNNKRLFFQWKASAGCKVTVPTRVTYRDDFGVEHEAHANYAKFLLGAYKDVLRFVEEVKEPEVAEQTFAEESPAEPAKRGPGRPRKQE